MYTCHGKKKNSQQQPWREEVRINNRVERARRLPSSFLSSARALPSSRCLSDTERESRVYCHFHMHTNTRRVTRTTTRNGEIVLLTDQSSPRLHSTTTPPPAKSDKEKIETGAIDNLAQLRLPLEREG